MPYSAADIAKKIRSGERKRVNNSLLIYGGPKTGKTKMAASIAKIASIKRVIWFDCERGSDTIFSGEAGLSEKELEKIEPVFFKDTSDRPIVAETMLKVLTSRAEVHIDQETGKTGGKTDQTISVGYKALDDTTAIVFDTISQVADSVFALQKMLYAYDDNRRYWGEFHGAMNIIMGAIQSSSGVNILLAQELLLEGSTKAEEKQRTLSNAAGGKKSSSILVQDDRIIPVCGSQPYSLKAAKYPSTVVRLYTELKKYKGVSSPVTLANVMAGSRQGVDVSKISNPTIADLLKIK